MKQLIHFSHSGSSEAGTFLPLPEKFESLVGSPSTLRSLGRTLRINGYSYTIERVTWNNFNRSWKGFRGLAIKVSNEAYQSLFTGAKAK